MASVHPFEAVGVRVRLREVDDADAPQAMSWASEPEFFRFLPVAQPASIDQERAFLREVALRASERPRLQYEVGIEETDSEQLVGMVRLGIISVQYRTGDLGYGLRRDAQGRGLATEAAVLMLRYGFGTLGLHRVYATHHPDNHPSARLLTRLGMTCEGVLHGHRLVNGERGDSVLHAILKHDFEA
jgi:[ribosomal protein S5]-alanine N-acetyltransferase